MAEAAILVAIAAVLTATALYRAGRRAGVREAERQARESATGRELYIRDLLEKLSIGFAEYDTQGKILASNTSYARMAGYEQPEDVIGRNVKEFMLDQQRELSTLRLAGMEQVYASVLDGEIVYLQPGGQEVTLEYSALVDRDSQGKPRLTALVQDISRRKAAETAARDAAVAKSANTAKSRFLASMSHEIRTPLNGVIGNLELLGQTALGTEQFELVDNADKAAKSLLALIGNILDFSKIEAGKLSVEMGDLDPAALAEEAVQMMQSRARQKGIFIAASFAPDVPALVRSDALRIRQILLNLIGNAVKFTSAGGIHLRLAVAGWDKGTCLLRFTISDSGAGFTAEQQAKLFQPFVQDAAVRDAGEGTGLGLSICRGLVEVLGGAIACEGASGAGASFWFTLVAAVIEPAAPVATPDLSGRRVLIAGADRPVPWLREYFTTRGAEVVSDPTEAISADAVIATDGALTPEVIAGLHRAGAAPVVAGVPESAAAQRRALRQGFAATISGEPSAEELDRNIRALLGQARTPQRTAEPVAAPTALRGKHVLVLEDRLINQVLIQKQLDKLGVACTIAGNGVLGLTALEGRPFDMVFCDCSMPEMNGYDFTREVRRREQEDGGSRIPIVALTANAFREDAEMCAQAGMDDFVSKPVTIDRLASVLSKWVLGAA